jgi:hypothetical protein
MPWVTMRAVVLALVLPLGCGNHVRPAVIPNLSQVPEDKRGDVIESALVRPTSENQPRSKQARKVETAAATAAAILGDLFSKTKNTSLGFQLLDDTPEHKPGEPIPQDHGEPAPPQAVDPDALVPWVHLK